VEELHAAELADAALPSRGVVVEEDALAAVVLGQPPANPSAIPGV
jgi:hypothetical protein